MPTPASVSSTNKVRVSSFQLLPVPSSSCRPGLVLFVVAPSTCSWPRGAPQAHRLLSISLQTTNLQTPSARTRHRPTPLVPNIIFDDNASSMPSPPRAPSVRQ
ncbi:unnamed protein product [Chondrus crispus]|uniref:Uncharacterized protein n=1 Tax=Chondrus crispus TaxID=2769 RepID=R7Q2T4_CHOCR|nr:unnamed protein product [Chondrus crispus]CDF32344.1 unnamed protein product [Chondrus crispus]|eukprot:XP_005712009.1 unnamed protein product [Chondrus crispus]